MKGLLTGCVAVLAVSLLAAVPKAGECDDGWGRDRQPQQMDNAAALIVANHSDSVVWFRIESLTGTIHLTARAAAGFQALAPGASVRTDVSLQPYRVLVDGVAQGEAFLNAPGLPYALTILPVQGAAHGPAARAVITADASPIFESALAPPPAAVEGVPISPQPRDLAVGPKVWICPTHHEQRSDDEGKCPRCGQDLVETRTVRLPDGTLMPDRSALYRGVMEYVHACRHCRIAYDGGDQCPACGRVTVKEHVLYRCPNHPDVCTDKVGMVCDQCGSPLALAFVDELQ